MEVWSLPDRNRLRFRADALNAKAVLGCLRQKRPLDNPPIVHIADFSEVYSLVEGVSESGVVDGAVLAAGPHSGI